jgi:glycosyltransferase involved in cell wall biosynthesis
MSLHTATAIPNKPEVIMIGSDPGEQGGIGTVLKTYAEGGFLDDKIFLVSHKESHAVYRVWLFAQCFATVLWLLLTKPSLRLVHMHMSERGSFFRKALLALMIHAMGRKVAYHLHGAEFLLFYQNSKPAVQKFIRYTLDSAEALFVLSKSWKVDLAQMCHNQNICVVYNPVVYNAALQVKPVIEKEPVRFLFMGRFGQRKGIYDLIRAVALIPNRNFKISLHGDGELAQVRNLIAETGTGDAIEMTGWIRGAAKVRAFQNADVLLLPSYNEGLPVAILEALSYGMAVISTPVGGIAEAVHEGENGLLVRPGDIEGLAKAIETLSTQAETLVRYKQRSRQLCAQHFAHMQIFSEMDSLYRRIIDGDNATSSITESELLVKAPANAS